MNFNQRSRFIKKAPVPKLAQNLQHMGMKQPVKNGYFAFEVNEYHWKRISFTHHRTLKGAEIAASKTAKNFVNYESPVEDDVTPMVMNNRTELESFAQEHGYRIDWIEMKMIHKDVDEQVRENKK